MDVRDAEAFLGLPMGAFDHIPIYARKAALAGGSPLSRSIRPGWPILCGLVLRKGGDAPRLILHNQFE
jgi:hypothetical protein